MKKTFKFKLVTPNGTDMKDADIEFLRVRSTTGDVGILAGHADYVTVLSNGKMEVKISNEDIKNYYVSGGFLEVKNGYAVVVAEDLIDYDTKDIVLEERQKLIEQAIKEKIKEDKDVLGTKKKIKDSLRR